MRILQTILLLLFFTSKLLAHQGEKPHGNNKIWNTGKTSEQGSFLMLKNGEVYIQKNNASISHFPLAKLSSKEQKGIIERYKAIEKLNKEISVAPKTETKKGNINGLLISFSLIITLVLISFLLKRTKLKATALLLLCLNTLFFSFTDPNTINAAFSPFLANVTTSWDNNYFYVESKGIPTTHTMMVGISNHGWQQQVPIPQCYTGNNHWSIPLNPIIETTPVPVNESHFTRGAIALAINGVPIFNPYTNTGVDAFLDGQLDNFGGHCGRGDDYHYHTAPLHLYNQTTSSLPIAYALDGFAVYGSLEPDGSAMSSLDINHGHSLNGVYHYHGTTTAPYMIKNMVGQVTENVTLEIVPQAHAQPVRTENWGPLSGALITSCIENASNNGYNLSYTLNNGSPYATNYSWNGSTYTFNYVTPSGTTTTNYNGFLQCNLALAINNLSLLDKSITIYPNPSSDILNINLGTKLLEKDVKSISIYDLKGTEIFHSDTFKSSIDTKKFNKDSYIIKIQVSNSSITKRFFVN